uniref:Uncharacterized protein n=1 Tax=Timema douglasi TaxID=61478 RepID=A0A7R8VSG6_TIMDO|nr:unnamed protein product [Timema douglasi]
MDIFEIFLLQTPEYFFCFSNRVKSLLRGKKKLSSAQKFAEHSKNTLISQNMGILLFCYRNGYSAAGNFLCVLGLNLFGFSGVVTIEDAKENVGNEVCIKKTAREVEKEMGGADIRKCSSERRKMEAINR